MINDKTSGLHAQTQTLRAITALTQRAADHGAQLVPTWRVYGYTTPQASFSLDAEPTAGQVAPWLLALDTAVNVSTTTFEMSTGRHTARNLDAVWNGTPIRLTFTYPCPAEQKSLVR